MTLFTTQTFPSHDVPVIIGFGFFIYCRLFLLLINNNNIVYSVSEISSPVLTLINLLDTLRLRRLSLVVSNHNACDVPKLERLSSLVLSRGGVFNRHWNILRSPNIQKLIAPVPLRYSHLMSILHHHGCQLRHLDVWCYFAFKRIPQCTELRTLDLSKLEFFRLLVLGSSAVLDVSHILRFIKKMSNATTIILRRPTRLEKFTNQRLPLPDLLRSYIGSRSHDLMKTHCRLEVTHEAGEDIYRDLHIERGE